jgi:hypothetical protein
LTAKSRPRRRRWQPAALSFTHQELALSRSLVLLATGLGWAAMAGCDNGPGPVEKIANSTSTQGAAPESAPAQYEPPMEDDKEVSSAVESEPVKEIEPSEPSDEAEPRELTLEQSGISFVVPAGWKQVKPPNRIVEAEFELPRVEGDEYDGRLTLMSASGNPQQVIDIRTAEFRQEPAEPAIAETLRVGDIEAQLIDLRGEWRDSIRASQPRADYRMLLLIVPFSKGSAFYAKLTGPRSTIAAHEAEFREFVRTAKITR